MKKMARVRNQRLSRRVLLGQTVVVGAGAWVLGGCGAAPEQPLRNDGGSGPGLFDAGGEGGVDGGVDGGNHLVPDAGEDGGSDGGTNERDAGHVEDGGVTPQCLETEDNILGPFYRAGAPFRTELATAADGELLQVYGTVSGRAGSCLALPGALLDIWQADSSGAYDNTSPNFLFRGRLNTDSTGAYAFQTVLPGRYLNGNMYRPRHIHLRVSAPGHVLLTTQLYFEGDPFLSSDPFVRPSLVVPLEQRDQMLHARFDIVLAAS